MKRIWDGGGHAKVVNTSGLNLEPVMPAMFFVNLFGNKQDQRACRERRAKREDAVVYNLPAILACF